MKNVYATIQYGLSSTMTISLFQYSSIKTLPTTTLTLCTGGKWQQDDDVVVAAV